LTKYRDKLPVEHPISLVVKFYMPVPKSWPKYKKDEVKNGLIHHTKKPDLDNLVKFVKDNLNEVAWKDDSQVYELKAIKQYSFEPETRIIIQTWT
jgi:Holliday junction resolvase RusA-like endonuclease